MKKKKSHKPLTLSERITIELRYRYGESMSNTAKEIGRNKSSISREIDGKPRTGVGKYNADSCLTKRHWSVL